MDAGCTNVQYSSKFTSLLVTVATIDQECKYIRSISLNKLPIRCRDMSCRVLNRLATFKKSGQLKHTKMTKAVM